LLLKKLLQRSIMSVDVVKVNNGKYDVFVIANDEYIGPCIARGYEWDAWMRTDVEKYYKPGTDIIDMGANIGYKILMCIHVRFRMKSV